MCSLHDGNSARHRSTTRLNTRVREPVPTSHCKSLILWGTLRPMCVSVCVTVEITYSKPRQVINPAQSSSVRTLTLMHLDLQQCWKVCVCACCIKVCVKIPQEQPWVKLPLWMPLRFVLLLVSLTYHSFYTTVFTAVTIAVKHKLKNQGKGNKPKKNWEWGGGNTGDTP